MAYNLTGAADFVAGNGEALLQNIVLGSKSFDVLRVEEGIKNSEKRPDILDDSTVLQVGDYTDINRFNGGVKVNDVTISVSEMFLSEKYNARTLASKVTQLAMRAGANPDDLPYEDFILGLKRDVLRNQIEKALWTANTATTANPTYLKTFDGFVTKALAATDAIKTGVAAADLTAANAIASVNKIVDLVKVNFPAFLDVETRLFMSPANFITYFQALYGLQGTINTLSMNTGVMPTEVNIPGTNIIATAIPGLAGNVNMIWTRPENLIIGTDLVSDEDRIGFEWHSLIKSYELFANFKIGAQIARTNELIVTKA